MKPFKFHTLVSNGLYIDRYATPNSCMVCGPADFQIWMWAGVFAISYIIIIIKLHPEIT